MPATLRHDWEPFLHLESDTEKRRQIELYLDRGLGSCILRHHEAATIVQETLLKFDPERYRLLEWIIMPNHVHVLIEMGSTHSLSQVMHSWKSYTATMINRALGTSGTVWQADYFDRYIRDQRHFEAVVEYIRNNAVKAELVLKPEDWICSSAHWRSILLGE
ncbi:MAG: transposase [bacterium]